MRNSSVRIAFRPQPNRAFRRAGSASRRPLAKRDAMRLVCVSVRFSLWPAAMPTPGPAAASASASLGKKAGSFWPSPSMVDDDLAPRAAKTPERTAALCPADLSWRMWRSGRRPWQFARRKLRRCRRSSRRRRPAPHSPAASKRGVDLAEQKGEVLGFVAAGNDDRDGRLEWLLALLVLRENRGLISIDRWPAPPRRSRHIGYSSAGRGCR